MTRITTAALFVLALAACAGFEGGDNAAGDDVGADAGGGDGTGDDGAETGDDGGGDVGDNGGTGDGGGGGTAGDGDAGGDVGDNGDNGDNGDVDNGGDVGGDGGGDDGGGANVGGGDVGDNGGGDTGNGGDGDAGGDVGGADGGTDGGDGAGGDTAHVIVGVGYGGRRIVSDGNAFIADVSDVPHGGDDDDLLRDVCAGVGASGPVVVAVGGSRIGRMMTSSDGTTWTTNTDNGGWLGGCAYGNGMFVAAGSSRAIRSFDGVTWQDNTSHFEWKVRDVAFAAGVFVGAGDSGLYTSADGVTWTQTSTHAFKHVLGGPAGFIAVSDGEHAASANGSQWTLGAGGGHDVLATSAGLAILDAGVDHAACLGAACAGSSWPNALHRSSDGGATWSNDADPGANALEAFAALP